MGKVEPGFSQRCILQYIELAVRARENKIGRVFLIVGSSFLLEQVPHLPWRWKAYLDQQSELI